MGSTANRTVAVELRAKVSDYVSGMRQASAASKENAQSVLAVSTAERSMQEAIDKANSAIKANGTNLDQATAKGRANRAALDQIASSTQTYRASLVAAGRSQAEVTAATEQGRKAWVAAASAMGMGEAEAAKLSGTLFATSRVLKDHQAELQAWSTGMLVAGGAVVAGLAKVAMTSAEFDHQMSAVAATGDEARASLDGLSAAALKAGRDTAFSATEAAQGVEALLKAGLSAKDVLSGGLTGALSLAAAGELSVGDAAEITSTALSQFALAGDQASHVADLLSAGAGKARGDVSDLAMALNQSGLVANQFGLSVEDTVGTLTAFAAAGLLGSDSGTSFKTMLLQLANPSNKAASLMGDLGIAAYDAQGKFVGITNLAGQLQSKLGSLTQEQRNSALATIFGTDAIRAANVLYTQGASGMQSWIDQTNDAGYAAKVAATRMDNLAGDLKQLSGSIDAAAIQSGSGLNTFLRGLTQNATGAVNAVGDLPAPLLDTATRIAALTGVGLIGGSMLLRLASSAGSAWESFSNLRAENPKLAGQLQNTSKAAGRAAAAFLVLQAAAIAGTAWQDAVDKANGSLADMAESAVSGVAAINKQFSTLNNSASSFQVAIDQIAGLGFFTGGSVKTVTDLNSALAAVNQTSSGFGGAVEQYDRWRLRMVGLKTTTQQVDEQFAKLDQVLSTIDPAKAQAAFTQIQQAAQSQNMSVETLIGLFPEYKASLQQTADQLGVTGLSAQQYADWMGGKIPAAVSTAAAANPKVVQSLNDTQQAAVGATTSLKDLVTAMFAEADTALSLSGSQVSFERMLDNTAAATKKLVKETKNKTDLTNVDTKAGQNAKDILNQIAAGTISRVEAMAKANASQKSMTTETERGREALVKQARQMGFSEGAITNMVAKYDLIPQNISTTIKENGSADAQQRIDDLLARIKKLPKSQRADIEATFNNKGIKAAETALDKIDHTTAHPKIDPQLTKSTVVVKVVRGSGGSGGGRADLDNADGGILGLLGQHLVRQFASGGFGQPQIRPFQGAAGVQWGEAGSGPWEAFISGAPQKKARSIAIWREVGQRLLGGFSAGALLGAFADGGIAEPTWNGQTLSYWQDQLKTPLELTRLEISIRDLKKDLSERETYRDHGRKKTRLKLRNLDRTEAQQQLAEDQTELNLALKAKQLNESKSGTIEAQIAAWDAANAAAQAAADAAQQAAQQAQDAAQQTASQAASNSASLMADYMQGSSVADLIANMQAGASRSPATRTPSPASSRPT